MDKLLIQDTAQTPFVSFDAQSGVMEIKGRAIPDDEDAFWLPVLSWFEEFMLQPCDSVTFRLNLEYFNISSSKRILFLLYKLNELVKDGKNAKIEWHYKGSDLDMYEVGQDYAYMVKVPFEFVPHEEYEFAMA